jgi:hypothetical protein
MRLFRTRKIYSPIFLHRESLDACVGSCDEGCELVLCGYSQGGNAATVASVDLVHYQPDVITFGTPVSIIGSSSCTTGEQLNHYRFVSTRFDAYDNIPNVPRGYGEKHLGNVFLLDDVNFPLCMPSEPNLRRSEFDFSEESSLHSSGIYRERISAIADGNCFPLPVARWPVGHYCHYDDECDSKYCLKGQCKKGL